MEPFHFHYDLISKLKSFSSGFAAKRDEFRNQTVSSGFTIVEMLVVLAIIITITGVTLTGQSSFNKTFTVANTAYDVALTLRSAQNFGISSRSVGGSISNIGYGIHIQRVPSINVFTLFADTDPAPDVNNCHRLPIGGSTAPNAQSGDCIYDIDNDTDINNDTKIKDYNIENGVFISDFCALMPGGWTCAKTSDMSLQALDIVFSRPNSEPFIHVNGNPDITENGAKACIALSSVQGGASHYVTIFKSGLITANATSCP